MASLAGIGSDSLQLTLVSGHGFTRQEAESNDFRQSIAAVFEIAAGLLTCVFFLIWVNRANNNLRGLGGRRLTFAIGAWLIPLANLIWPYFVLKRIHQTTVAALPEAAGLRRRDQSIRGVLLFWWILFVFSSLAALGIAADLAHPRSVQALYSATQTSILIGGLRVAAALLAMAVVLRITNLQEAAGSNQLVLQPAKPRPEDLRDGEAWCESCEQRFYGEIGADGRCPLCGAAASTTDSSWV